MSALAARAEAAEASEAVARRHTLLLAREVDELASGGGGRPPPSLSSPARGEAGVGAPHPSTSAREASEKRITLFITFITFFVIDARETWLLVICHVATRGA
ncbi:hypothetical protein T492DRAFT_848839 [Pavlovales sp. CCMP2436]|nr:hypothetical protein T492DRAFT_848839 [Pavlovales sp. CCMP2436]